MLERYTVLRRFLGLDAALLVAGCVWLVAGHCSETAMWLALTGVFAVFFHSVTGFVAKGLLSISESSMWGVLFVELMLASTIGQQLDAQLLRSCEAIVVSW